MHQTGGRKLLALPGEAAACQSTLSLLSYLGPAEDATIATFCSLLDDTPPHAFYNHSLFLHELLSFGQLLKGLLVWNVVQFLHTLPWGCPERHCQLFTGVSWCSFTCLVLYNIWKCYSEEEWIQFLDLWTFCINILAPLQRIEENTPSFVGKLQNSSS